MVLDGRFMARALRLAEKFKGCTSPNPWVGAVVVKGGKIVGEGFHKGAGTEHAETIALKKAGELARGATLYVTLEPCSHHGRTPPCTSAILEAGIEKVMFSVEDPRSEGEKILKSRGVDVKKGILKDKVESSLSPYLKFARESIPYVIIKMAATLDGKTVTSKGESKYITSEKSLRFVHKLRALCDAVLVGANTILSDNPKLTVRFAKGRDPVAVIIDLKGKTLEGDFEVFRRSGNTIVFTQASSSRVCIVKETKPDRILRFLGELGIMILLVEGGSETAWTFLPFADEIMLILAPKVVGGREAKGIVGGDGLKLEDALKINPIKLSRLGEDILIRGGICSQVLWKI